MGVAKGWVGRWVAFLRVRFDSVLLIRHRDQAALSPGSTGPTRLCTRKLRRALAVMCTKHENNQHAHCSRLPPSPFYFFCLFQIPTTAVHTHGKWKPNISCRFRQM